jgi:hypothetical protein
VPPSHQQVWKPVSEEQLRSVGTVPQALLPNQRVRRDTPIEPVERPRDTNHDTMVPLATPAVVARSQQPTLSKRQRKQLAVMGAVLLVLSAVGMVLAQFQPALKGDAAVLPPMGTSLPNKARAQLRLLAAVDATRAYFLDHGTFEDVGLDDFEQHEPALTWKGQSHDVGSGDISVDVTGDARITLASQVESGVCAFARDVPTEARTETVIVLSTGCRAEHAPKSGWSRVDYFL